MPIFRSPNKNLMLGFPALDKTRQFTDGILIVPDSKPEDAQLIRSHPSFGIRFFEDAAVTAKSVPVVPAAEPAVPSDAESAEQSAPTAKRTYNKKNKEGAQ